MHQCTATGKTTRVYEIYKGVVYDIYSAKIRTQKLEALLAVPAIYIDLQRCRFVFVLLPYISHSLLEVFLISGSLTVVHGSCLVKLKLFTKNSV